MTPSSESLLTHLQSMDNYEFEHLIADFWKRQGWKTSVTQSTNDAGIDVVATKEIPVSQKVVIQAKRYGPNTTVGGPAIQQYSSLKYQEDDVDSVIIVTSNRFSSHAQKRARELNVKTVDGEDLVALIEQLDARDLLNISASPVDGNTQAQGASASIDSRVVPSPANSEGSSLSIDEMEEPDITLDDISPDTYLRVIQGGTAVWSLVFLLAIIGYSGGAFASLLGITAILCWILLPPALYYEAERVSETTYWTPYKTLYAIGGALPFLNALVGGIYLYRRYQAYRGLRSEESRSDEAIEVKVTTREKQD